MDTDNVSLLIPRDAHKYEYTWKIKKFSDYLSMAHDQSSCSLNIYSPPFPHEFDDNTPQWYIDLHIHMNKSEPREQCISIYIKCLSLTHIPHVLASSVFYIINGNNEKIKLYTSPVNKYNQEKNFHGYSELYKTTTLIEQEELYLPNKTFTFVCEMNVCHNSAVNYYNSEKLISIQKLKIATDYSKYLFNKEYSDVTFIFNDKNNLSYKCIPGHKVILAARNHVFSALFNLHKGEKNEKDIIIYDIELEVFQELLRFLYTGEVEKIQDIASNLLHAADKYQIKDLKELCEESLSNTININNAAELLIYADRHNAQRLSNIVTQYFYVHMSEIIQTENYMKIEKDNAQLLFNVYRDYVTKKEAELKIKEMKKGNEKHNSKRRIRIQRREWYSTIAPPYDPRFIRGILDDDYYRDIE